MFFFQNREFCSPDIPLCIRGAVVGTSSSLQSYLSPPLRSLSPTSSASRRNELSSLPQRNVSTVRQPPFHNSVQSQSEAFVCNDLMRHEIIILTGLSTGQARTGPTLHKMHLLQRIITCNEVEDLGNTFNNCRSYVPRQRTPQGRRVPAPPPSKITRIHQSYTF